MLFNLHNGQMRFSSIDTGSKPIFRDKSPKKMLMMAHIEGTDQGIYRADKLGNIDVVAPQHIDVMIGLGYPIYNGDGRFVPIPEGDGIRVVPVPWGDLIYPNLDLTSSYWRRINEAKNLRCRQ